MCHATLVIQQLYHQGHASQPGPGGVVCHATLVIQQLYHQGHASH